MFYNSTIDSYFARFIWVPTFISFFVIVGSGKQNTKKHSFHNDILTVIFLNNWNLLQLGVLYFSFIFLFIFKLVILILFCLIFLCVDYVWLFLFDLIANFLCYNFASFFVDLCLCEFALIISEKWPFQYKAKI